MSRMKTGKKTDEDLANRAEYLLDSSTQKALKGLAYVRLLKERVRQKQGYRQWTLTAPGPQTNPNKQWTYKANPEQGYYAECWHCHSRFTKQKECEVCRLYLCPKCNGCGCQLSEEAKNAVYCTLKTVFGFVGMDEELAPWPTANPPRRTRK